MLPHWRITRFRRWIFWCFAVLYAATLPIILLSAFGISRPGGPAVGRSAIPIYAPVADPVDRPIPEETAPMMSVLATGSSIRSAVLPQ